MGDVGEHTRFQTQEIRSQCAPYRGEDYHAEGAST